MEVKVQPVGFCQTLGGCKSKSKVPGLTCGRALFGRWGVGDWRGGVGGDFVTCRWFLLRRCGPGLAGWPWAGSVALVWLVHLGGAGV